jgi:hypothetical protein
MPVKYLRVPPNAEAHLQANIQVAREPSFNSSTVWCSAQLGGMRAAPDVP